MSSSNYTPSKAVEFFTKINKIWSIAGLYNLWIIDEYNNKTLKFIHKMITFAIYIFIFTEYLALLTQPHLTEKQSKDLLLFVFCHPIFMSYYVGLVYHKKRVKDLLIMLNITLKDIYNDPDVEKRMIRRATIFSIAYQLSISVSVFSYGFDGLMQVLRSDCTGHQQSFLKLLYYFPNVDGNPQLVNSKAVFSKDQSNYGTFTTVVTAWPNVTDKSSEANLVRVFIYLFWWIYVLRITAVSVLTIMTSIALSHQYRNIQSYFHSLNDLFKEDADENNNKDSEIKYLKAVKVGIKQHSITLWCTQQFQETGTIVISGQIIINVSVLCLLMSQMLRAERTLENALVSMCTIIAILAGTGMFMLNTGDITIEAALVPTTMYSSGWQNCRNSASAQARRLLVLAMMQGQRHVALRSFGIVEISYESFVSIVKSSYSIFSLLY